MILGIKDLQRLVEERKLVENLSDREINNPEGAGFDLRLGEIYELSGDGFLGIEERNTPKTKTIAQFNPAKETYFNFEPGKYYLVKTIEKVNLPENISGIVFSRTTLFRSGLALFNGIVQPGYCGELSFGLCNFGKGNMKISLGARVVHITFHEISGFGNSYRGQWQGGRVSTKGKERQI